MADPHYHVLHTPPRGLFNQTTAPWITGSFARSLATNILATRMFFAPPMRAVPSK